MKEKGEGYTTNKGDYLIIQITGMVGTSYIAEVIENDFSDLRLKVVDCENHPFANLRWSDFIVLEKETVQFQKDCRENTNVFLESSKRNNRDIQSGLESLDIKDGKIHHMHPAS